MKYLLAKYGFIEALDMLKIVGIVISDKNPQDEEYYTVNKCYEIIYNDLKELNI